MRRASPMRAPQAGSAICTSATARARTTAKCPISMIMASLLGTVLGLGVLPQALLLQSLLDLGGHVPLVVLGEHTVGDEAAGGIELTFRHHALALAEEVGEYAGVADGDGLDRVGDGEADGETLAALEAAFGNEAAEADALASGDLLGRHLGGRVEEDDGVAQRKQHEQDGDAED